jgi:hypothetical protein
MTSRIRFSTARNVFEAFADLALSVPSPSDDAAPLDYAARLLGKGRPRDAVAFLAYLLPRREAVWWARQCVQALLPPLVEDAAFRAAETWVREPEEEHRRAALDIGRKADRRSPTTWLALAAGWSGGSTGAVDRYPLPPPASACAKAANAAIVLAACVGDPRAIETRLRACAEAGLRFADGGEARVSVPKGGEGNPRGASGRHIAGRA